MPAPWGLGHVQPQTEGGLTATQDEVEPPLPSMPSSGQGQILWPGHFLPLLCKQSRT